MRITRLDVGGFQPGRLSFDLEGRDNFLRTQVGVPHTFWIAPRIILMGPPKDTTSWAIEVRRPKP